MAYIPITTDEIDPGKPTKNELFSKIRGNFIDHESRIVSNEAFAAATVPITFDLIGPYWIGGTFNNALQYILTYSITVQAVRLYIDLGGTVGTTEVDIKYKRGVGAFTSIFSTLPSVGFAAGDNATSTNAVLTTTSLLTGDILRLDITSVQTNSYNAYIRIEYDFA